MQRKTTEQHDYIPNINAKDSTMTKSIKLSTKARNKLKALAKARLPELRAEYAEIVGETTRSPNRTFLLRKISETLTAASANGNPSTPRKASKATQASGATTAEGAAAKQRGRFSALTIPELKAKYLEVVGRETGSSDRAYLIWKIREAESGRVPVGPRKVHAAGDMTTLPFRIPTAASEAMDEAWRARGVKSRNRFLQDAVAHYLAHLGDAVAAEQFSASPAVAAS
jgi:hypothetical protein